MVKDEEINSASYEAADNKFFKEIQDDSSMDEKILFVRKIIDGIAHEIRNPLSIILQGASLIEFLSDDGNKEANETIVEMIKKSVRRINDIINRLVNYSKPFDFEVSPQNIYECVDSGISLLGEQLQIRNIKVEKDYAKDIIFAAGNKDGLAQVFFNLGMNAVDAMPRGGRIVIKIYREGDFCAVEFKDTGLGIARQELSKIFEPFYTTKSAAERIGLGLAVVQLIMKSCKGTIRVESVLGEGTNFILKLPLADTNQK